MGSQDSNNGAIGIVVSGGPAPGINSVIGSSVIEARNRGITIYGLKDGFKAVSEGDENCFVELKIEQVSVIHNTGGSILGTSRTNPLKTPESYENLKRGLAAKGIDRLIIIGGEGSAFISYHLSEKDPSLKIAHIPKTIDNDLVLPNGYPCFGFETARFAGTKILETLMVDARTTKRWFVVTSMGRKAGFLALGLGIAAGATLTIIPEEFRNSKVRLEDLAGIVFGSLKRRIEANRPYGIAVVAEGVLDLIDPESSSVVANVPTDELGRLIHSELEIGEIIQAQLREMLFKANLDVKVISKNIGYELRCREPVSFDIEYTKFLGHGAIRFLAGERITTDARAVMITRDYDALKFIPLDTFAKPDGTIMFRQVDLNSDLYRVARSFMIR